MVLFTSASLLFFRDTHATTNEYTRRSFPLVGNLSDIPPAIHFKKDSGQAGMTILGLCMLV